MANKFIVATRDYYTGYLKFGMVALHSDLKSEGEAVFGGGEFKISEDDKTLELYGKSFDFGRPIFDGWEKLKISSDFKGMKITYHVEPEYPGDPNEKIINLTNKLEYDDDL